MTPPPLRLLQDAVFVLGLTSLSAALAVYFLMEIRYRRQVFRQARRLILESQVTPLADGTAFQLRWQRAGQADREILEEILVEQLQKVGGRAHEALQRMLHDAGILKRWTGGLRHRKPSRRQQAAMRLGYFRHPRAVEAMVNAADDPSPEVRLAVTLGLGRLKDPAGISGLVRVARWPGGPTPDLTLAAALAACAEQSPTRLAELLKAPEARLRMLASWALSEIADQSVLPELLAAVKDRDAEVRAKVARALGRIPWQQSIEALERMAQDPVWFVKVRALDALGRIQNPAAEGAALRGLEDKIREVRYRAAFALRQMRGMKGEVVQKVLATGSRRSFNSLISEWDRAGFLWQVVAGLSTRDWPRYGENLKTLEALIAAGVTRGAVDFVLVYPDLKVRLRLLKLLLAAPSPALRAELLAMAKSPGCDPRVAAKITRALAVSVGASDVAGPTVAPRH